MRCTAAGFRRWVLPLGGALALAVPAPGAATAGAAAAAGPGADGGLRPATALASASASASVPVPAPAPAPAPEALRAAVRAFGPWPPPVRPDPRNRRSGDPRAIELGRLLFRDARLGPLSYIACVSCHQPDRAFTDGKPRGHGLADLPRNTPALFNLRQQSRFGWEGTSASIAAASIRPILDAREFDGSAASVVRMFVRDSAMAACYRQVFGVSPLVQPERTLRNVGLALAAWLETLVSGRTPFDDYRDALVRGDAAAARAYPAAAQRGLAVFVAAGCAGCHAGPNFSDGRVHAGAAGSLRTPSLRNVAVTAPYLHDGSAETLEAAISRHPAMRTPATALARRGTSATAPAGPPPALGAPDVQDVQAFLRTLTDRHGAARPWPPSQLTTSCRPP